MTTARAVAMTARGRVRPGNQDAVVVFEWMSQTPRPQLVELRADVTTPALCAVADGMGGHAAGELASSLALAHTVSRYHDWTDVETLRAGLVAVNDAVFEAAGRDPRTTGMGTTIAGITVAADRMRCFNVGDSRVYRITDGYVEQLSVDDTAKAPDGTATNRLTQALGDPPGGRFRPHVTEVELDGRPARFLLCTDGVTAMLDPALFRKLCRTAGLHDLVTGLRDAVYDAGAEDNLSIAAVELARAT
ncbi:MAG TPA: protein phosphatase 2C domain-containing protein [Amycolatopsis sp.]|uniref:PP2C family protein-serine/threonine phosphatase n=1 Tax=Amycolatopsis sp. TaxID=37632 RepID=UPI002B49A3C4|nr:protein phosphatase 2C domain-containing protein [Amycolatopsis sp.]HKS50157.1 protein phosphatase 2C domain-containing protein [Amycolatopsis sp.]